MIKLKTLLAPLTTSAALAILAASTPAHAADTTCTVKHVAWNNDDSQMAVYCSNTSTWYTSKASATLDAKKIWVSMSQAALLAGKNVRFSHNTSGASVGIYWMRLDQ